MEFLRRLLFPPRIRFAKETKEHDGLRRISVAFDDLVFAFVYGELSPFSRPPPRRDEILEMAKYVYAHYARCDLSVCASLLELAEDLEVRLKRAKTPVLVRGGGRRIILRKENRAAVSFIVTQLRLALRIR